MSADNATSAALPPEPWWKFPYVWMVIAGPVAAMVVGFSMLFVALGSPDPVVAQDYYRRGIEINKTLADRPLMPAMTGRNHATTPAGDVPVPAGAAR
ncbi:MAG: nitrogen fixation protein FixH [Variovorax sp.]|nr:MAG: nitrogen fixation protein FixH [Variovorax sp.]